MLRVIGEPPKVYSQPSEVAWDHDLGLDRQIHILEKWMRLAAERYRTDRSQDSLNELRTIHWTLSFLTRSRDV